MEDQSEPQKQQPNRKKIAYVIIAFAVTIIIGITIALPYVIEADITSGITAFNTSLGCTDLNASKGSFSIGMLQNYYYADQLATNGNIISNPIIAFFLPSYFSIIRENYSIFSQCILNITSNFTVRQCYNAYFRGVPLCQSK
jgi:hypothetical protein